MHLRRFLFTLFALALAPPGLFGQSKAGPFTINSSTSPCASISVTANATVGIQVTGTFSATLQPEVSIAGQAAQNAQVTPSTSSTAQSTITAAGIYSSPVAGFDTFLVCVSSYASGTATVYLTSTTAVNASLLGGGGGSSGLAWNLLSNATANLSIQNGTHTTTFDQTAAEPWLWANTTAATSSTPQSSPIWELEGTWWGPTLASAVDGWSLQDIPGSSTTMAAGLVTHCAETSGLVTLTGAGMTVFPNIRPFAASNSPGSQVIFQGFTTCTWLNGLPVSLVTNSAVSITFYDPTGHANQGSVAEAAVTASSAVTGLTLQQLAGSAPVGYLALVNPQIATADSVNASPGLHFTTNSWNGTSSSIQTTWNIFSQQLSPCGASCPAGGTNPSLIFSLEGNNPAQSGDSIIFSGQGTSPQDSPQLGFYHDNGGFLTEDGQFGFEPSDGVTDAQGMNLFVTVTGVSAGLLGNAQNTSAADVTIGGVANETRPNVSGPNYGVVMGGITSGGTYRGGYGNEVFDPASGSSANYGVYIGTQFNPGSGSSTFSALYLTPNIIGTTSGNTTAFTVAPVITTTNLTGTNLIADFQSAPGTSQVNFDYHGDITTAVLKSAAGTALPTCNAATKGAQNVVSDATTPTYLGTYTSGGAVVAAVLCNGTNWVTH
jgi:hypothetical protein